MRLKKWLLGFATFAAMVVICAVCAGAETYGDFEYSVLDDGTVGITKYIGNAEKVDIPAEIDGKKVTEIGRFAFENHSTFTSVTIPDSVIHIGTMAFATCDSLESVKLPGNLKVIEEALFAHCKALKSINIPDGVTSIDWAAFLNCTSLTSVTIPDSVTSIKREAFFGCTSLKSVTIPASVVSIGEYAFGYYYDENRYNEKVSGFKINYVKNTYGHYYATKNGFSDETCFVTEENYDGTISIQRYAGNEKTLTIPSEINGKQVDSIAFDAFADSENLESVTIPDTVTYIESVAFPGCISLTSISIPETVTGIGDYAFLNCPLLKSVTIPASTDYIGEYAFGFCGDNGNFTKVDGFRINYVKNTYGHYYAIKNGFASGSCLATKELSDGTLAITGYAGEDKSYAIPSEINGKKVTAIYDDAFAGSNMLTNVTIPNSITMIGYQAFINCPLLKSVTIPASVDIINDKAFGYMVDEDRNLTKVDGFKINYTKHTYGHYYAITNGFSDEACLVTEKLVDGTVGIKGFVGNDSSITVPSEIGGKKVTEICNDAFSNNTTLTSVDLPDTIRVITPYAFAGCTSLENITIPDSVISVYSEAFDNTAIVNNQTTPVKYVGNWVVGCDRNVKTVSLKEGTVGIASSSFYNCEDLQSVTIPDSVKNIGYGAFENTAVLNNQTTPVKYVDKWVVDGDNKIKTASIKEGTVGIAEYAFGYLGDLASIKIPDSVKYICVNAFAGCTSLENVEIPDSVTSIGDYAFFGCVSLKSVTIPDTVKNIGERAFGYYFNSDKGVISKYDGFNIYCYGDSVAEKYAKDNGFEYEILECKVHKFGEWKITKDATCTENGTKVRICTVCGKEETVIIPAKGHQYTKTVVAPTYTSTGYTLYKCSVCGYSYKEITGKPGESDPVKPGECSGEPVNPPTGAAVAVIPALLAAAAVATTGIVLKRKRSK